MKTTTLLSSALTLTLTFAAPQFPWPGFGSGSRSSTRNDLVNGECKAVTVIFARGTGETGNVGTVTGPPFFTALSSALGADNVAVQGVDYAASTAGFTGDARGNAQMASLIDRAATQCPGTNVVVSGYS